MFELFDARLLLALSCAAALTACGGGDDGTDADPVPDTSAAAAEEKYLGTWQGCAVNGTGKSVRATYQISKNDSKFSYSRRQETFNLNETCSGSADGDSTESGPISLTGKSTTVEGVAMDQASLTIANFTLSKGSITGSFPQGTYQQVLGIVDSTKLREGDPKAPKDAQGYPSKLGSVIFVKQ